MYSQNTSQKISPTQICIQSKILQVLDPKSHTMLNTLLCEYTTKSNVCTAHCLSGHFLRAIRRHVSVVTGGEVI